MGLLIYGTNNNLYGEWFNNPSRLSRYDTSLRPFDEALKKAYNASKLSQIASETGINQALINIAGLTNEEITSFGGEYSPQAFLYAVNIDEADRHAPFGYFSHRIVKHIYRLNSKDLELHGMRIKMPSFFRESIFMRPEYNDGAAEGFYRKLIAADVLTLDDLVDGSQIADTEEGYLTDTGIAKLRALYVKRVMAALKKDFAFLKRHHGKIEGAFSDLTETDFYVF